MDDDDLIAELGDRVEAKVPDMFRDEREIDAEIVRIFKNGKLRIRDLDGDREYTVEPGAVFVLAKGG